MPKLQVTLHTGGAEERGKEWQTLLALSLETRLSAGWEIAAHRIPARYPAAKDTPSCSVLLHSDLGFGTTLVYRAWTMFSNAAAAQQEGWIPYCHYASQSLDNVLSTAQGVSLVRPVIRPSAVAVGAKWRLSHFKIQT